MKRTHYGFGLVILFISVCSIAVYAGDNLGKLHTKAGIANVGGQEFADPQLQDSVKDLKERHGNFVITDKEADADYLMVVLERNSSMMSPGGTPVNHRSVTATLSMKDGDSWKPLCKLTTPASSLAGASWGNAARSLMGEAQKCLKTNAEGSGK